MISKILLVLATSDAGTSVFRVISPMCDDADLNSIPMTLGWNSWWDHLPEQDGVSYTVEAASSSDPRGLLAGATIEETCSTVSVLTLVPANLAVTAPPAEFTPAEPQEP